MKEWDENIECAAKNQKIVSPNIPFNNSVTEILQDISGIEEFDNNITKKSEISNEMIFEATKRNYRLIQEMQKEIYNLKKSLQSTTERKKNYERDTSSNAENAEDKNDNLKRTNSDFERDDSMIEIGRKGSDVYLNKNQWETATSRTTYTGMAISLLCSLFPKSVLLKSNLNGGKSKVNKNTENFEALDSNIVQSIRDAVREKFPQTYNYSGMGSAINNKLSAMRRVDH